MIYVTWIMGSQAGHVTTLKWKWFLDCLAKNEVLQGDIMHLVISQEFVRMGKRS